MQSGVRSDALYLETHRHECDLHRCRRGRECFVEASTLSASSAATVAPSPSPSPSAATVALSPSAVIIAPSSPSSTNAATCHLHHGHIHRLVKTNLGLNLVVEIDHVLLGFAQLGRRALLGGMNLGWPPLLGGRSSLDRNWAKTSSLGGRWPKGTSSAHGADLVMTTDDELVAFRRMGVVVGAAGLPGSLLVCVVSVVLSGARAP